MNTKNNNNLFRRLFALLMLLFIAQPAHTANIPEAMSTWILGASSSGQTTKATFSIGVTADSGQTFGTTLESWQSLDILSDIRIAPEHIGKTGSIYLVALYNNVWYMKNSRGEWLSWNLALNSLSSASENQNLEATTPIAVQKQLSNLPGRFSIWVGYKTDGEMHYNAQPFSFTVIAKEKPTTTCTDDCIANLLIPENSYGQSIPAEATAVSSDVFIQGLKEGSLTLTSAQKSAEQLRLREASYQDNLAALKSLKISPVVSSLLEALGKTTNPFFEPTSLLDKGQQVQLLSLNERLKETITTQNLGQSPENALNYYQQSYDLLPDNLKNDLPTLAMLQGKSVAEINAAIAQLDNALAGQIKAFENISVASVTPLPKVLAGKGSDNNGVCQPQELAAKFHWPLKAFVSPVKDQGQRGMCWAFTVVGALESREKVQRDVVHDLSEQFLVNRVKRFWDEEDYEDGYSCTRALEDMLKHNQVLPEESFWTYNRSLSRNINASSDAGKYANSCLNYSPLGSCGDTAHQTRTVWNSPIPGLSFAAYEDTRYRGAGVAASKPIKIWKSGDTFYLRYYRFLLSKGYTIMASFGVREGFKNPTRGFVTNYKDGYTDAKGKEKSGSEGDHAVQIVGFIDNEAILNLPRPLGGGSAYIVPGDLPASGGYFVVKNSWGCNAGDGGYYYIPAEYIQQYFNSFTVLAMDTNRSANWQQNGAGGRSEIKLTEGSQLKADLRVAKKLFEVYPPLNKKIEDVSIQVSSSVAGDQLTLSSTFGNFAVYSGYFVTPGPRTVKVIAGSTTVQSTINVDVINTAPIIELSLPPAIYEEEVITLNVVLKDINEASPGAMCSRVTWHFTAPDFPYSGDGACKLTVAFGVDRNLPYRSFTVSVTDSEGLRTNQTFTVPVYPKANNPYPRITDASLHYASRLVGNGIFEQCLPALLLPPATGEVIDLTKPNPNRSCSVVNPSNTLYEASVKVENPNNETLTYRWQFFWVDNNIRHTLDDVQGSSTYSIPRTPLGTGGKPFACGVNISIWGVNANAQRSQDVWLGQCIFPDIVPR